MERLISMKRFLCMLLMCATAISFLSAPVKAADIETVWLEDLKWEWVDLECCKTDIVLQTTDSISRTISPHSIGYVVSSQFFQTGTTITFNCSYSPSSASMDFGVIDSNSRFYYINVKGGSINQAIRISQGGNYQVAVRNNSSDTVYIAGFVSY